MNATPLILTLGLIGAAFAAVVATGHDSHHFNLRYLGWKAGLCDSEDSLRFFGVDISFRENLLGKTPREIERWFPHLVPPAEANDYQRTYRESIAEKEILWLGDSWWYAVIEDQRVARFGLAKG